MDNYALRISNLKSKNGTPVSKEKMQPHLLNLLYTYDENFRILMVLIGVYPGEPVLSLKSSIGWSASCVDLCSKCLAGSTSSLETPHKSAGLLILFTVNDADQSWIRQMLGGIADTLSMHLTPIIVNIIEYLIMTFWRTHNILFISEHPAAMNYIKQKILALLYMCCSFPLHKITSEVTTESEITLAVFQEMVQDGYQKCIKAGLQPEIITNTWQELQTFLSGTITTPSMRIGKYLVKLKEFYAMHAQNTVVVQNTTDFKNVCTAYWNTWVQEYSWLKMILNKEPVMHIVGELAKILNENKMKSNTNNGFPGVMNSYYSGVINSTAVPSNQVPVQSDTMNAYGMPMYGNGMVPPMMPQMGMSQMGMPPMMPQMGVPPMMPQMGMPQMGMSPMMPQMIPQMSMPAMMPQMGMSQMGMVPPMGMYGGYNPYMMAKPTNMIS